MGRMFRIITEAGTDPADKTAESIERGTHLTMNPYSAEGIPFIEVGGPEGVVSSYARPAQAAPATRVVSVPMPQRPAARVLPMPEPAPLPTRYAPMPVPMIQPIPAELRGPTPATADPRVLSVAFHKFPKPGLRILPTGVAPEVVTYHYPDHPISSEYRLVRDEIRRSFDSTGQRVVTLTSTSAAAGTTTVLLNVAVAMTQDTGARVLVVDANLMRPAIASRLAVGDAPGVSEVLAQMVPLAWAVQTSPVPGLHVLATGAATDKTLALLPTELPRLLTQVRQWFDYIFVDVGPWDHSLAQAMGHGAGGASHLATVCDAAYLVTRHDDIERLEFHQLRASMGGMLKGYITTRP